MRFKTVLTVQDEDVMHTKLSPGIEIELNKRLCKIIEFKVSAVGNTWTDYEVLLETEFEDAAY